MRVLVTGANGDIGDAVGRILVGAPDVSDVIGVDAQGPWPASATLPHAEAMVRADDPSYVDALAAACDRHRVDVVVPTTEPEIRLLARQPDAVAARVLVLAPAIVGAFTDKLETARWFESVGVRVGRTCPLPDAGPVDLPVVVKPRFGWGSKDIAVVTAPAALAEHQGRDGAEHMVAQEYLDGDDAELTCTVVRLGGATRTLQLRRTLVGGMTHRATVESLDEVDAMLQRVAEASDLDGSMNVQLRLTATGPAVFEVNPRLSSTVMMRHLVGFEDLLWWLRSEEQALPPYSPPVGTRIARLSREVVEAG